MSDEYQRDRDEVLAHIRDMFSPILEAVDEAWNRDKERVTATQSGEPEPLRTYSYGFVAGMEYQKLTGKVQE